MNYSSSNDQPLIFRKNSKAKRLKCSSQPPKPSPKPKKDSDSKDDKPLSFKRSVEPKGKTNYVKPQVYEDSDDEPLIFRKISIANKLKCSSQPLKPSPKSKKDSDSKDDKPLSFKRSVESKRKANHVKPQVKYEDSDDEPLIFRKISIANKLKCSYQPLKPSPKPKKDSNSEDDKPISVDSKGKTNHFKPQVKNEDSGDEPLIFRTKAAKMKYSSQTVSLTKK